MEIHIQPKYEHNVRVPSASTTQLAIVGLYFAIAIKYNIIINILLFKYIII